MAATTAATVNKAVQDLAEVVLNHVSNLNEQIAALEERVDAIEDSGDKRKSRGRNMTPEQRQEAGRRLQQARADKLGLETIEQLRELHLAPGKTPTKAEIKRVLKEFPADAESDMFVTEDDEEDDE